MKKILLALVLSGCALSVSAQDKPSTGDLYDGLTRPLTFDRMIPPYALEVTFDKTTHVIFPAAIRYVGTVVKRIKLYNELIANVI